MTKQLQLRRGSAAQHSDFVGAQGELTVVTDDWSLRVHDGSKAGGNPVSGAGDMAATVYDPRNVAGDAFDASAHAINAVNGLTATNVQAAIGELAARTGTGFVAVIAGADAADAVKAGTDYVENGGNGHAQISQAIADGARALVLVGTVTCSSAAIIDVTGERVDILSMSGASLAGGLDLDASGTGTVRLDVTVTGTVTDTGGRAVRPVYTATGSVVVSLTQAEYDAITPDASTLYAIVG